MTTHRAYKKRILLILLTVIWLLCLCACSGNSTTTESTPEVAGDVPAVSGSTTVSTTSMTVATSSSATTTGSATTSTTTKKSTTSTSRTTYPTTASTTYHQITTRPKNLPEGWDNLSYFAEQKMKGKFSFVVQTDTHFYITDTSTTATQTAYNAAGLSQLLDLRFIANLGDVVRGYSNEVDDSNENMRRSADEMVKRYTENAACPVFLTIGNHEPNSMWVNKWGGELISAAEHYDRFIAPIKEHNGSRMISDGESTYYYMDFPDDNIRVIVLNSTNDEYANGNNNAFYFSDRQIQWLESTALKTDHAVLIMTHTPLLTGYLDNTNTCYNAGKVLAAVDAFKENGGVFIAYMYGHVHKQAEAFVNDELHVSFRNGGGNAELVMIDQAARTISTMGFGGVSDREMSY